jgi:hypothetical protein
MTGASWAIESDNEHYLIPWSMRATRRHSLRIAPDDGDYARRPGLIIGVPLRSRLCRLGYH